MRSALLPLLLAPLILADDHDHDHHHDEAFEWAGVFEVGEGDTYGWTASGIDGVYADATMKFVALEVSEATIDEATEEKASHLMEEDCIDIVPGQTFGIGTCYNLNFDLDLYTSVFPFVIAEVHNETHGDEHDEHEDHDEEHEDHDEEHDDHEDDHEEEHDDHEEEHDEHEEEHDEHEEDEDEHDEHEEDEEEHDEHEEDEEEHDEHEEDEEEHDEHEEDEEEHEEHEEEHDEHEEEHEDEHEHEDHDEHEDEHEDHDEHEEHEDEDHDHDHDHDHVSGTYIAIFTEHYPTEFEDEAHYLKDGHGHDIEPLYELGSDGGGGGSSSSSRRGKAWRLSMLATFIVLCCTVVGAILRIPSLWGAEAYMAVLHSKLFVHSISAFGAGALLACSVYLMLFESTHLIQGRWSEETQATWRFGTMAIAGWACGAVVAYLFEPPHEASEQMVVAKDEKAVREVDEADAVADNPVPHKVNWALVFSVIIGDFFHNFVDGLVVARAFLDCNTSKGWTVAAATVYHELAQEVSDFSILVNVAGLEVIPALIVNVLSGTSVMLGAAVYMWTKPGDGSQGLLLSFAGGVYLYLAITVAANQFLSATTVPVVHKLKVLFFFVVGVIAIGLVLLDHEHCVDSDGGGGGHHGHAHI